MLVFNRDMLNLARAYRGVTQKKVARESGFTQALISRIENGFDTPSAEIVASLSKVLGFPKEFFYQERRAIGFPQYHARKRARLGARALQKIEAETNLRQLHIEMLTKAFEGINAKPIPSIDLDEKQWTPQQAAQQMRGLWMVPRGPVNNLIGIIEEAGIVVIPMDFSTHLLDALSFRLPGLPPLIFINKDVPGDRFRFTLAHELGHLLLHNSHPLNDGEMEYEADKFAAEFLMPATEIRPHLKYPSLGKLGRVKTHWKVSIKSLIYNAHQLKLITPAQYRGLMINYSKAGYSRGEPFPINVEEPRLLSEMIAFHLENLGYSISDMANFIKLDQSEFENMYIERPHLRIVS